MAKSYKEYVEGLLKERYEDEGVEDQLDTRKITLEALNRKKKKKKRPYSRATLQNRLRK